MTAETAAEGLDALYVDELRQSLLPPVHPMVNRRQTEALIGRARTAEPAACTEPDAATWIWSDLHLGHEHSRSAFGRPFRTAAADDEAMMEAWYEQVAEGETIICLGDVTVDGSTRRTSRSCSRGSPAASSSVRQACAPLNSLPVTGSRLTAAAGSTRRGRRPGRWHRTRCQLHRTRCQLHCPNPVQAAGTSAVTHRHLEGDLERVQIHDRDTVRGSQPQIGT